MVGVDNVGEVVVAVVVVLVDVVQDWIGVV